MANRTIAFATYTTDGTLNNAVTPTVTVSYNGAAATALTPTANGSLWNVTVDDTQDATLLISGEGLATADLIVLRRDLPVPDNAGITAIKAKTDNLPDTPAAVADVQVTVPAPVFDGTVTIDPPVALQADERAKLLSLENATGFATATQAETLTELLALLRAHATNRLTRVDNGDGTLTVRLYNDDGTAPLLTWQYDTETATRAKAN